MCDMEGRMQDLYDSLDHQEEEKRESEPVIERAWVEQDSSGFLKLCIRYVEDTGAEALGCFRTSDAIRPSDFEGISLSQACDKFNRAVYPNS